LELKVGVLVKTWHHPESEKLFLEEVRNSSSTLGLSSLELSDTNVYES
jgi:hypothetical protein